MVLLTASVLDSIEASTASGIMNQNDVFALKLIANKDSGVFRLALDSY